MKRNLVLIILLSFFSNYSFAEGWCNVDPGFNVITHGTKSETVYLLAKLSDQPSPIWIPIVGVIGTGSESEIIGKNNLTVALAAQMADRQISIYLDLQSDTCSNFPSWAEMGRIRHIRLL